MDGRRFDALARLVGQGASRRTILKGLLGIGGATVAGALADESVDARTARSRPTIPPPPPPTTPAPTTTTPAPCPGQQQCPNSTLCCPTGTCARSGNQAICCTGTVCGLECCDSPYECCDGECCADGSTCLTRVVSEGPGVEEEICCDGYRACDNQCCDGACFDPQNLIDPRHATPPQVAGLTCCPAGGSTCTGTNGTFCCQGNTRQCCHRGGEAICITANACCTDDNCAMGECNVCDTTDPINSECIDDQTLCPGECDVCSDGACIDEPSLCTPPDTCTASDCIDGACSTASVCTAPNGSCCGDDPSGCTNTQTDRFNCGSCGTDCTVSFGKDGICCNGLCEDGPYCGCDRDGDCDTCERCETGTCIAIPFGEVCGEPGEEICCSGETPGCCIRDGAPICLIGRACCDDSECISSGECSVCDVSLGAASNCVDSDDACVRLYGPGCTCSVGTCSCPTTTTTTSTTTTTGLPGGTTTTSTTSTPPSGCAHPVVPGNQPSVGNSCSIDAGCCGTGSFCCNGICLVPGSCCPSEGADCPVCQTCVAGVCRAIDNVPRTDCVDGMIDGTCCNGACTPECAACTDDDKCRQELGTNCAQCGTDGYCFSCDTPGAGLRCCGNQCVFEYQNCCNDDSQCGSYCADGDRIVILDDDEVEGACDNGVCYYSDSYRCSELPGCQQCGVVNGVAACVAGCPDGFVCCEDPDGDFSCEAGSCPVQCDEANPCTGPCQICANNECRECDYLGPAICCYGICLTGQTTCPTTTTPEPVCNPACPNLCHDCVWVDGQATCRPVPHRTDPNGACAGLGGGQCYSCYDPQVDDGGVRCGGDCSMGENCCGGCTGCDDETGYCSVHLPENCTLYETCDDGSCFCNFATFEQCLSGQVCCPNASGNGVSCISGSTCPEPSTTTTTTTQPPPTTVPPTTVPPTTAPPATTPVPCSPNCAGKCGGPNQDGCGGSCPNPCPDIGNLSQTCCQDANGAHCSISTQLICNDGFCYPCGGTPEQCWAANCGISNGQTYCYCL